MRRLYVPALLLSWLLLPAVSFAVPGSLTYQGRIKNTDGMPLEYNGVKFEFSITNPTGSCSIYRETSVAVDMRNSGGIFDVPIGPGSKAYPSSSTFKLLDSFDNNTTFTCENGGTYTPLSDDIRLLRVQFFDGIGWRLISPDSEIRAVPFAGQAKVAQSAQKLGSNVAGDFILKSNVPLCAAGHYLRHIAPIGTFECNAPSVAGVNVTGNITGSSAGFTGNLSGDVSGTQGSTSVGKIQGVTLDMTGIAPGKVLKYNGTSWAPADDEGTTGALTGLTGDVTSTGNPLATVTLNINSVTTTKIADGSITSAKIADGTIVDGDISGSANIADTKLATIATAGKVSGNAMISGTIGGSTSINTSGTVISAAVSANTLSTSTLQIYKTGNGNKVTITVPTSLSPDYSLQLPGNAGNPGQILSTDGSGVLSWVTPSSGSMTSVTATSPLVSTGGATPNLSLSDSGVVVGTYSKVTVDAKGLVTTGAALSSADIPNLNGDVTSTSGTSSTKVEKIQGINVSSTTPQAGQVLVYGSNWAPQYFGMGQLRSTVTGNPQIPASCSTADKTLTWSAITDSFACTSISIANTQVTGLGTASTKNFGTAAGNLVELDGTGRIPASLLPSSANSILDGGNSTGTTVTVGTNDSNSLAFKTNSTTKMTITSTGNVGIGSPSPSGTLDVNGNIVNSGGYFQAMNGSAAYPAYTLGGAPTGTGMFRPAAGGIAFSVVTGERMRIDPSGNVGIGTATPGQKLTVDGTIESTNGGFKFPDGTTQSTAPVLNCTNVIITTNTVSYPTTVVATCAAGYTMTGGGCYMGDLKDKVVWSNEPSGNGWSCGARNSDGSATSSVRATARCCKF